METTIFAVRVMTADNGSSDLVLFADRGSAEHYAQTFKTPPLGVDRVEVVERLVFGLLDRAVIAAHRRMWDARAAQLAKFKRSGRKKSRAA